MERSTWFYLTKLVAMLRTVLVSRNRQRVFPADGSVQTHETIDALIGATR